MRTAWLLALVLLAAPARARPAYLDVPSKIVLVGATRVGERVPVLVVLPPTGASAEAELGSLRAHVGVGAYVALVPAGVPARPDYDGAFGAYLDAYAARIDADLERALRERPEVDPARIYLAGFSLGGDLAWSLLLREPSRFAGALVIGSGCSAKLSHRTAEALKERDVHVVFVAGDLDPRRAGTARALAAATKAGVTASVIHHDGGHELRADGTLDAAFTALFRPTTRP